MIKITNLKKKFKDITISYQDLTFETNKSYILLGASGCGKSTLLNMIAGISKEDEGTIIIDDIKISDLSIKEKDNYRIKNIGYIFQDFKLINEMSVKDNIDILSLENVNTSNMDEILEELEIKDKKYAKVKNLSGGQKQRCAIARALVKKPSLILADEPTGNLNFEIGEKVCISLLNASKNATLIVVSHDERLVKYFDYAINMNEICHIEVNKDGDLNV